MSESLFLKLDAIPGQSTVAGFEKQIEVMSWSHGVSQAATNAPSSGTRTSASVNHSDFNFVKTMDESSIKMLEFCNKGEDVKTATFTIGQADGPTGKIEPLWVITLTKAIITSVSLGGSSHGGLPTESFSINYATIKWEYKAQTADAEKKGTASTAWDLTKNAAAAGGK
jgi:type VI secretion system secreted protein Hcp